MKFFSVWLLTTALLSAQTEVAPPSASSSTPPAAPPPAAAQAEQLIALPEPGRFKALFQPFRTETAALSPDGKYLAYTIRDADTINVAIIEVDQPAKMTAYVKVLGDQQATVMLVANQSESTPARVNWMKWVSPTRLVLETNQVFSRTVGQEADWQSWRGAIIAFDADGGNVKTLVTPYDLEDAINTQFVPPDVAKAEDTRSLSTSEFMPGQARPGNETTLAPTPDQAPLPDREESPLANFSESISTNDDFAGAGATDIATRPRELRVFDVDFNTPGSITFVSTGAPREEASQWVGHYTVDATTGKMTRLTDELAPTRQDLMLDRQGRLRIGIDRTKLSGFPLRYEYYGEKGRKRGKPLDQFIPLPTGNAFSVSPDNFFGARAIPIGFDEDPNVLYYASNLERDTYGIYAFNFATNQRTPLALENPSFDLIGPPETGLPDSRLLIFDRYKKRLAGVRYENAMRTTAWLQPAWNKLQAALERQFQGRFVEIIDWNQAETRFLFNVQGPGDPGAFYIYDSAQGKVAEFVRRAPWVDETRMLVTVPFSYRANDGGKISGLLTLPKQPRLKPYPMVVLCPDLPWQRVRSSFQTDVQALADMGFVVVQLNGRGAWGLGLQQRQSLAKGYDLVQLDDIVTTLANLEQRFQVNAKRVAILGRGHGGFIALRAVQQYPDKFRCAVAIDAPVDIQAWLEEQRWSTDDPQTTLRRAWLGDAARLAAKPLTRAPEAVTKPILMLNYPGPDGEMRTGAYARARQFAGSVRQQGTVAEFADLRTDYIRGLPGARSEVFEQIEGFLNQHIYSFTVKIGETTFKDELTR